MDVYVGDVCLYADRHTSDISIAVLKHVNPTKSWFYVTNKYRSGFGNRMMENVSVYKLPQYEAERILKVFSKVNPITGK